MKNSPEIRQAQESRYIAYYKAQDCYVNLAGRYDYMEMPYYLSQDLENDGLTIHPTCKEMLDAYITPIFLEKARLAGLAVPESYITNAYFEPPVIVDTINPFMMRSSIVLKAGRQEHTAKSLTRNFKYAICCQEIPENAAIRYFRAVMGWSTSVRYRELAAAIWEVFHLPLARVRVIVSERGEFRLSNVVQLPYNRLNDRELAYLHEKIQWRT